MFNFKKVEIMYICKYCLYAITCSNYSYADDNIFNLHLLIYESIYLYFIIYVRNRDILC